MQRPDRKAQRVRIKAVGVIGVIGDSCQFYNEFRKRYPQHKDITNKVLGELIWDYNGRLWKTVLEWREGLYLPEFLGLLRIQMIKPKKQSVNYGASIKAGKRVRFLNLKTEGLRGKIVWNSYIFKRRLNFWDMWKFESGRIFSTTLSHSLPETYTRYIVVDDKKKIEESYEKNKNRIKNEKFKEAVTKYKDYEPLNQD